MADPIRIDLGCGPGKKEGFVGVDSTAFPGVDIVADLRQKWPFEDDSVAEAHASHFVEHLTNFNEKWERVHFFNELYRVLIPGGKATIIIPHWCSNRYYGDPTHKEPLGEMAFYYLLRAWRLGEKNVPGNAPHADITHNPNGYLCDFDATWGYTMHPALAVRNTEYQQHALGFWKEAAQDIIATLICRK